VPGQVGPLGGRAPADVACAAAARFLQFTVGPAPDSLTVYNATSVAWRMLDTVYTTRPVLAQPLPLPNLQYLDFEVSKAAPLALQVHNCADLKVGGNHARDVVLLRLPVFLHTTPAASLLGQRMAVAWKQGRSSGNPRTNQTCSPSINSRATVDGSRHHPLQQLTVRATLCMLPHAGSS
jgi:hypothetical protein